MKSVHLIKTKLILKHATVPNSFGLIGVKKHYNGCSVFGKPSLKKVDSVTDDSRDNIKEPCIVGKADSKYVPSGIDVL